MRTPIHRSRGRLVAYLVVSAAFIATAYFGTPGSDRKIHDEVHARCIENQANRAALRVIILRERDVGRPGTPGYAYFKAHPGEAEKARERVDQALADLPPVVCE